jgi:hypothetical protein
MIHPGWRERERETAPGKQQSLDKVLNLEYLGRYIPLPR